MTFRRTIFVVAVVVGLLLLRFGVHEIEDAMQARPEWLPPAWQNRIQSRQSAATFRILADADVGFVYQPNLSETITTDDYTFLRTSDSLGFPNVDAWPEQADIVFTGDSLVVGEGVGYQGSFIGVIADALKDQRVLNLGDPGAGVERQRVIYERYGEPLKPSLVIACVFLASDLTNDRHWYAWRMDPLGMEYNEFRLGYAERTEPPPGQIMRRLGNHPLFSWTQSYIEPLLWEARRIRHRLTMPDGQELYFERDEVKAAKRVMPTDHPDLVAISTALDRFRERVTSRGARFGVMLIPSKEEIFAISQPPPQGSAITRVRDQLEKKGVAYLDLYPVLRASGERATPYFKRDIHMTRAGNQVTADAFLQWYASSLKAQSPN